jgi:hypothetical protein
MRTALRLTNEKAAASPVPKDLASWLLAAALRVGAGGSRESCLISLRAYAPIDRKRVPGDVLGLVGEQPDDRISDLFGLANPPHGDK